MTELKMRQTDTHVYFVAGPFSQWHPSPFESALPELTGNEDGSTIAPSDIKYRFSHAEQAMMASKASVFRDQTILEEILRATSPKKQKELGRQVANFDSEVWQAVAFQIVAVMNFHKFARNPDLCATLLETGDRHLVEGAWYDRIWGVGIAWDDPKIDDEANWDGTNWLGEALMAVRHVIRNDGIQINPWRSETLTRISPR